MNARTRALVKMANKGSYAPRAGSKGDALKYYMAKRNKKKIPVLEKKEGFKNPEFAKMSQKEFEKKYPW